MELGLQGKRVLVTGGTRGIGLAIVQTIVQEGGRVALCARNEQQVAETVAIFQRQGLMVSGCAVDITNPSALTAWIDQAADAMGGIDIVVANPSSLSMGVSAQDWKNGFELDLMGTVHTISAAEPHLERASRVSGDAAILVISSAAIAEADTESAYGAYKAALVYHAKGAARRLAAKKIRVNSISPGTIYSDDGFWGNVKKYMPEMYEGYLNKNPMGRMGSPQEVANAATFLCSPAASFVTGTNLIVDGGITSRVNY
jgi:3-oxoacyl-[acyl-carrier protein] reductase